MSIPGVLGADPLGEGPDPPYLFADAARVASAARPARRRARAPAHRPVVEPAIRAMANNRRRSCPLAALAPLLERDDIAWYSLQRGDGEDQIPGVPAARRLHLLDERNDFDGKAALIASLDLVDQRVHVDRAPRRRPRPPALGPADARAGLALGRGRRPRRAGIRRRACSGSLASATGTSVVRDVGAALDEAARASRDERHPGARVFAQRALPVRQRQALQAMSRHVRRTTRRCSATTRSRRARRRGAWKPSVRAAATSTPSACSAASSTARPGDVVAEHNLAADPHAARRPAAARSRRSSAPSPRGRTIRASTTISASPMRARRPLRRCDRGASARARARRAPPGHVEQPRQRAAIMPRRYDDAQSAFEPRARDRSRASRRRAGISLRCGLPRNDPRRRGKATKRAGRRCCEPAGRAADSGRAALPRRAPSPARRSSSTTSRATATRCRRRGTSPRSPTAAHASSSARAGAHRDAARDRAGRRRHRRSRRDRRPATPGSR